MKRFFLFAVLIGFAMSTLAQNTTMIRQTAAPAKSERWDLDKYVWSHTHPRPSKRDKPLLDFDAMDNWINVGPDGNLAISRDGKYFAYGIQHGRALGLIDSIVVQSTANSWRQSFAGASPGFFSGDSKQYIFQDKQDLCFLQAGKDHLLRVKDVASYQLPGNGKNEWLAYQLKNSGSGLVLQNLFTGKEKRFTGIAGYGFDETGKWLVCQLNNAAKELVIHDLATAKERHFQSVESYSFDADGKVLVLKTMEKTTSGTRTALQYVSLPEEVANTIWSTADSTTLLSSYSIDGSGKQVVFTVQDGLAGNCIWYYKTGMNKAVLKVNNQTGGIATGLMIQEASLFTNNDRYIVFSLKPQMDTRQPDPDAVQVDVWSYKDTFLQSTQPYLLKKLPIYQAILSPESGLVTFIENEQEKLNLLSSDFAIIKKSGKAFNGDRFWEKDYRKDSNWLLSLKDGSRNLLPTRARGQDYAFWFSPGGKYLVYYDAERQCNYYSYELFTGKLVNISSGVPPCRLGAEDPYLRPRQQPTEEQPIGVAAWLEGDRGVLVYDNYDIWQLDLSGKKPPVNITNGYGRSHQTLFSLMGHDRGLPTNQPVLSGKDTLLLRAFNRQNKYNGFYRKSLGSAGDPALLYMGPCFMAVMSGLNGLDAGMPPLKAAGNNTWIVKKQTATEAPNYFATSDFKTYKALTDLQPHKRYNWLTTTLVSFKQLDGTISQGVLYKPENFDPAQKYPVIISFYGALSDRLYQYPRPGYIDAPDLFSNPAWMVSHEYLVFTPDIYFTKGKWGPSTVNTIDGAARHLSQLPYVDGKHIGAVGHSNSGRFGYYLLTHSRSFAAMSIGSGTTNIMRIALSLTTGGIEESHLEWAEVSAYGAGGLGNLWQNKHAWVDHTSVLHADKITSPVLMYACKKRDVPVEEAVEMFNAQRRLENKAWWLQYDDGGHRLWKLNDLRDFTIRYTQFFDHYLKGAPAPSWMTEGIPFKLKGVESRYELDPSGECGSHCPVCQAHKAGNPAK
ncbi:prolyl oligopeptidase family serine peptidase [Pseudoflavitalea sp. X16]|uniref:alpha/beta hydrolase family protein n=1 Tax=Paraflavitalea devenefica TaxID=2716334 RepID=UPI00141EB940|nr:prolyl oligopeptidase family serine peptidase [Paraflavitalea devenefica]NII25842.1 prolyl oligopeptidase family serine peptidase [Paraflavitalea devenefica]